MDSPQNAYRAMTIMWDHQPVLLRQCPLVSLATARERGFEVLVSSSSPETAKPSQPMLKLHLKDDQVVVWCSEQSKHRFLECDMSKNLAISPYHIREAETQHLNMTLDEFVLCARRWTSRRIMYRGTALLTESRTENAKNSGEDTTTYNRLQPVSGPLAVVSSALKDRIDWSWLTGIQSSQGFGPVYKVDVEAGTSGGLQPARYLMVDSLLAQVSGRRRVLLLPPSAAFRGLYPYPVAHPYDGYSMVDLERLDPDEWPGCTEVRGHAAVLRPGDVLYVPAYWFVHEQDIEAENVTLRFLMGHGTRAPSEEAAPLRISRALEERVGAIEGPSGVKKWLTLIGSGLEVDQLDLGTVLGYKRALMCQGVRDEVEESLGQGAWAEFLPAMCRGRLRPTPWLNKDFREPLLLTDTPVIIEDTRSEEEKKYPTLFRRKLEAEGWNVPASVSTVPVPGVNMPMNADYRTL